MWNGHYGFVDDPVAGKSTFFHIAELKQTGRIDVAPVDLLEYLVEADAKTGREKAVDIRVLVTTTGGEAP
jgi:hypothetical protein